MKSFVEEYTGKNSRTFHFDMEVKPMISAVRGVEGVEMVGGVGRYNFNVWIGKCFDVDAVIADVLKVCHEVCGNDYLLDYPVLKENGMAELLDWVPEKKGS
jgi:hypothetical protein